MYAPHSMPPCNTCDRENHLCTHGLVPVCQSCLKWPGGAWHCDWPTVAMRTPHFTALNMVSCLRDHPYCQDVFLEFMVGWQRTPHGGFVGSSGLSLFAKMWSVLLEYSRVVGASSRQPFDCKELENLICVGWLVVLFTTGYWKLMD